MQKSMWHTPAFRCLIRDYESSSDSTLRPEELQFDFHFVYADKYVQTELLDLIETYIIEAFDETTIISNSDPHLDEFYMLDELGICDVRFMDGVSIQAIAKMIYTDIAPLVKDYSKGAISLHSVVVYTTDRMTEYSE